MCGAAMKLLVIDDCLEFRELVEEYSELCRHQFGLRCRSSDPGEIALEKIAAWLPELILVDAHAVQGGAAEIEALRSASNAQIVVTSEHLSPEIGAAAARWGAAGYIKKSRDPDEMELFLKRIADMRGDSFC